MRYKFCIQLAWTVYICVYIYIQNYRYIASGVWIRHVSSACVGLFFRTEAM